MYPDADDIFNVHEDIVANGPDAPRGVKSPGTVDSALVCISAGYFGQVPETLHEKAAHLMRLLAAEHPFWDGKSVLHSVLLQYCTTATATTSITMAMFARFSKNSPLIP